MEELLPFDMPVQQTSIIKVLGVGGGGSNAVNYMYKQGIKDVSFVVCNTDSQALINSPVPIKIQLGESLTEGRGAGNKPERGRQAAIESLDNLAKVLGDNTKMIFITAGMGGGTGTGAAPVIARAAREMGILTVAIVTLPFRFEGPQRVNQAIEGISELRQYVDSILVINNERLREMFGDLPVSEAFGKADNILTVAAKGIAEIITVHGYINVDFADVQTVMTNSGVAVMGAAMAEGPGRAIESIQTALNSPLLNNSDITGAKKILLNISSGSKEATMDEISTINEFVQDATGHTADLIWGNTRDDSLGEQICVTIIATGFKDEDIPELYTKRPQTKTVVKLDPPPVKPSVNEKYASQQIAFEVESKRNEKYSRKVNPAKQIELSFEVFDKEVKKYNIDEDTEEDPFMDYLDEEEVNPSVKKTIDRIEELKRKQVKTIEEKQSNLVTPDSLEYLESTPAFIRQKKDIEIKNHSKEVNVSRFSLVEDEKKKPRISENNPYLHDKLD